MTNKESYLSRGTTKEGKKVVGYYIKRNNIEEEHWIAQETFSPFYANSKNDFTQITSPPQKCLGIRDCEGELIFEGDEVSFPYITPFGDIGEDKKDWSYRAKVCFEHGSFCLKMIEYGGTDLWHSFNPISKWLKKEKGEYISNFGNKTIIKDEAGVKIVHPTNKEEIESQS